MILGGCCYVPYAAVLACFLLGLVLPIAVAAPLAAVIAYCTIEEV